MRKVHVGGVSSSRRPLPKWFLEYMCALRTRMRGQAAQEVVEREDPANLTVRAYRQLIKAVLAEAVPEPCLGPATAVIGA